MPVAFEANFDGLVGPTHNYSGLSHGNIASTTFKSLVSNPLEAVLQGLEKMKNLADEGFKQGLLPPHERPDIQGLRKLGFLGSDKRILEEVTAKASDLLLAMTSASSMWTANAATVSPSADTLDGRVHFTPANLISKFHRSIETSTTGVILKKIFKNPKYFCHHDPLPSAPAFGDEGAANHTRLCADYGKLGLEFFVYGRHGLKTSNVGPKKFPARQTFEASQTIARTHGLNLKTVVFGQQLPKAIDTGVFHNDVAGVGNQNVYFYHEEAYVNADKVERDLKEIFLKTCKGDLQLIKVSSSEVSLDDAVKSYLFNSQLLTQKNGKMVLIAPSECQETPSVSKYLNELLSQETPIKEVRFFNLRQSMQNGGGPACLRLRVVLTEKELKATHSKIFMTEKLYSQLTAWANRHYRDRLQISDLCDPSLARESREGLDKLTQILGLGSIYPFQRG